MQQQIDELKPGQPEMNWLDFRFEHEGEQWQVIGPDNAFGEDAPYWWALPLTNGELADQPTQVPTSFGTPRLLSFLHLYEVGMVSDKKTVRAPSAGAAAMYYALELVETDHLFMTAVYTVDGEPFEGEQWWMKLAPDDEHATLVGKRIAHEFKFCRLVEGEDS